VRLTYAGQDYDLAPGESVLEGLARHGVALPAGCFAGACHSCLLRAETGDPGGAGQRGLKPSLAELGYFLACLARPLSDLAVANGGGAVADAVLTAREWLSRDVLAIRLRPRRPVGFRAGQHAALDRGDGVARVYSLANLPAEAARDGLEFHVRVYPAGALSGWLASVPLGAHVRVGPAAGGCFYSPGEPRTSLLLAGTGTGIAPLLAVARDALARGHTGPVAVLHGSAAPGRLYLGDEGPPWVREAGIRWRACARWRGQELTAAVLGELALQDPGTVRAFLCGGARSVTAMRRALFLAGMSLRDICSDTFLPAVLP
jgi:CDP-4-dehydro-6-deoxyglucose reductase